MYVKKILIMTLIIFSQIYSYYPQKFIIRNELKKPIDVSIMDDRSRILPFASSVNPVTVPGPDKVNEKLITFGEAYEICGIIVNGIKIKVYFPNGKILDPDKPLDIYKGDCEMLGYPALIRIKQEKRRGGMTDIVANFEKLDIEHIEKEFGRFK